MAVQKSIKKSVLIFLTVFMVSSLVILQGSIYWQTILTIHNGNPDEAVFTYRQFVKHYRRHHPDLLRQVLYKQLRHHDISVRMNVAEVIGELNDPTLLSDLWKITVTEKTPIVRDAAVAGMINSKDRSVVKYFVRLLNDNLVEIRRKAAFGCGAFGDQTILNELEDAYRHENDELTKFTLAAAMVKLGEEKMLKIITEVLLADSAPEVKKGILRVLHGYEMILDTNMLREIMDRETNQHVKIWAASLLARKKEGNGLAYLKDIVSNDKIHPRVKSEAAKALSELGVLEYAYPYVLELLKEKDDWVREMAIEDLDDFKGFPLTPILGEILLRDENSVIREIAAWQLGERKNVDALPYLERGLYDESAFVRTGVIAALYKILKVTTGV